MTDKKQTVLLLSPTEMLATYQKHLDDLQNKLSKEADKAKRIINLEYAQRYRGYKK